MPAFGRTHHMLRLLPVGDHVEILLTHEYVVVLSTRMSDLRRGGCSVSCSLISFRTAFHENVIVAHLRLLIVIRSEDLVLRCFRVLRTMESGH